MNAPNNTQGAMAAFSPATGSAFMVAAVHAYHRSERDSFALISEALNVCKAEEWPGVSTRVRRKRDCSKLWGWALRRWGREWPRLEYDIRERPNTDYATGVAYPDRK